MIDIELLNTCPEGEYTEFLLKNPHNLIYGTLEFREFLRAIVPGLPQYLGARENNSTVGVLPCFRAENPELGVIINSLPWYGSYGGCVLSDEDKSAVRKALLERYLQEVMAKDVLVSTMILSPLENNHIDVYLHVLNPPFMDKRIGQITNLPKDGEELENRLLMSFNQKTRNLVRKAIKQGFSLVVSDDDWAWDFLYGIHKENMDAIGGKAKPVEHFVAMRRAIPPSWRDLLVAIFDDIPVAALLLFYFNKTVEYITPVIRHEYRSQQPLSFLIWQGMVRAIRKGYQRWNWGGTWVSLKSLHHFKAGWGAIDFPYTYLINITEEALSRVKDNIKELQDAFPYYYIFPFNQL